MATVPQPINLAESNELVSVENPKLLKQIPVLLWAQFGKHYPPRFFRRVLAEIIATYLLVFVTCGSAALSISNDHKVSQLGASVAGGLIVTVMIYAVGHISGAHMNPAVTLAFAAFRHFPWKQNISNNLQYFLSYHDYHSMSSNAYQTMSDEREIY
ncbi:aquaporin NIP2-1-like [Fagus crenata]